MGKERKKNANGWVGALLEGQKGRVGGGELKKNGHTPAMRSRSADGCPSAHRRARNRPSAACVGSPATDRSEYARAADCNPANCPAKSTTTLVLRVCACRHPAKKQGGPK